MVGMIINAMVSLYSFKNNISVGLGILMMFSVLSKVKHHCLWSVHLRIVFTVEVEEEYNSVGLTDKSSDDTFTINIGISEPYLCRSLR